MPVHTFVDEVKESGYLLLAAMLPPDSLASARKALRKLTLPGQHRPHFHKESDRQRRAILSGILGLEA